MTRNTHHHDEQPPPERFLPDSLFLESLERLGVTTEALKAIYPHTIWPAHWLPETSEQTSFDELQEPNRPYDDENEAIPADRAPQEPFSAPRASDRDLDHAENEEDEVPW